MTPHVVNPIIFVIPMIVLFIIYYLYWTYNRSGLDNIYTLANITDKKYKREESKLNNMGEFRTVPEAFILNLDIDGEHAKGFVTKELYQSLNINDTVHVVIQRTRIWRKLIVVSVSKEALS